HTLGSIVVTKTTIGAETPEDATFQLQNLSGDFWTNVGEAVAYSAFANGAYTFTELAEGTYRILESGAVIDGYTLVTTYSANVVLNKTTADNGDTSVNDGSISVTNRYIEISVPVHTPEIIEETQDISEADVDVQAPETTDSANVVLNETTANSGDTSANIQEMPAMEEEITVPEETGSEELVEISDEDVPMTDLPQTSDPLLLCAGFAMLSCIGLGVALKARKNNG
ncbi:MAG: hypothetical protein IIX70_03730, partial [Oscillospiraceae bacterium]|nr:hypothetical protein [Oscillospiraceae bacterium]